MDEDQALDRPSHAEQPEHARHGNEHDLERNETAEQQHAEHQIGAAELPFGQDISIERTDNRGDGDRGHNHEDRIDEIGPEACRLHADLCCGPGCEPRLNCPFAWRRQHAALADFFQRFQRIDQHDVERQQVIEGEKKQRRVDENACQLATGDSIIRALGTHLLPPLISE